MLSRTKSCAGIGARGDRLPRLLMALLGLYLFIYVWSVPMLMLDLVPMWGRGMGGFLLILQGTLVGLWLVHAGGIKGALAAATILVLSYLVELAGVQTGVPFGRYAYTSTLGLQLGGAVPLAIPFAWLAVVPAALGTAASLARRALVAPAGALMALLLDLLIEPVAAHVTGYWRWIESGPYYGVPSINFVAWGGTALLLAIVVQRAIPDLGWAARMRWLPALVFMLDALQFTLVDAAYGFWGAAGAGLVLLAGIYVLGSYLPRRKI